MSNNDDTRIIIVGTLHFELCPVCGWLVPCGWHGRQECARLIAILRNIRREKQTAVPQAFYDAFDEESNK